MHDLRSSYLLNSIATILSLASIFASHTALHSSHHHERSFLAAFAGVVCQHVTRNAPVAENKDAIEGETIRLPCRFNPNLVRHSNHELVYYWQKTTSKGGKDVAVVNANTLVKEYVLESQPQEGRYDLRIDSAQYDRDNGQFECKIKEAGSGTEVLSVTYVVTILSKLWPRPRPERVAL